MSKMNRTKIYPALQLQAESETYRVTGGFKIVDRWFQVPLDYFNPAKGSIKIFARNAIPNKKDDDGTTGGKLPYFIYLQGTYAPNEYENLCLDNPIGGPGFGCGPPSSHPVTDFLFEKGYQVLYIDQRGTGMSTPITSFTLAKQGSVREQADYVKLFRADNIVRDCEAIRLSLLPEGEKWSVIGQSFGGFCAVTYLSLHPEGLKQVFTTGGMPPLVNNPDEVYRRMYLKVKSRNKVYYEKYPRDIKRVRDIMKYLENNEVFMPSEGMLTPERFLSLGLAFGGHGGIDSVHILVQNAASDLNQFGALTYKTLSSIESHQSFDTNPIYAIGHEMIYCQGESSRWSAQRVLEDSSKPSIFSWEDMKKAEDTEPVYFTGEMIYQWMFSDFAELHKMEEVAENLAEYEDWPKLYDEEVLAQNQVPVFAATYIEDMYVDYEFARETAGKINGAKEFMTNVMFHNALRSKTEGVLGELWKLKVGEVD
ncbi:uncharacterized protein H6S33_006214 [Morchella sextelata]|uniref:uncharacterized protein n=1 Tax=Morchella sextelata TaxID=1174677 RepID=UPI001D042B4C|nr:uncharacterized protein H6S33_006214 [Morchella sextelata]KAH0614328.1 hypothetical protein H6S33_006214 [Morchella sextelata]